MRWFKHYHNASTSLKLQSLRDRKRGKEYYAEYWLLLELLCEKFDGTSTKIKLTSKEVGTKLELRADSLPTKLALFADLDLIKLAIVGKELEIDAPILLQLQDKDFKHSTKKRLSIDDESTLRIKNKNKIKEEDKDKEKIVVLGSLKIDETANLPDSYEFVRQQFNNLVSGKGNVKAEHSFFMPPRLIEKFTETLQIEFFRKKENWIKYFSMISESEFLLGISDKKSSFKVTIDWAIDPNNAGKVLSGKYSNNQTRGEIEVEESFKNLRAKYGEEA